MPESKITAGQRVETRVGGQSVWVEAIVTRVYLPLPTSLTHDDDSFGDDDDDGDSDGNDDDDASSEDNDDLAAGDSGARIGEPHWIGRWRGFRYQVKYCGGGSGSIEETVRCLCRVSAVVPNMTMPSRTSISH